MLCDDLFTIDFVFQSIKIRNLLEFITFQEDKWSEIIDEKGICVDERLDK